MCLAGAQTIPVCYFHQGGQSGKHNKNSNRESGKAAPLFQLTLFILSDVGMQNEVAHSAAIQQQRRNCAGNCEGEHSRGFACGI